jgi:hypothetical protein
MRTHLWLLILFGCLACGGGSSDSGGGTPVPSGPRITAFTATPSVITAGENSQLAWTVTGATDLRLNGQTITGQGTSVNPSATTTYTLIATSTAGSDSATVTVTVGNQAAVYANLSGADLGPGANLNGAIPFPGDNPWNTDISGAEVDPNSANIIASIGLNNGLHPDFGSGTYEGGIIGIPYVVVGSGQATVAVNFTDFGDESDPGSYPIPGNASIEGWHPDGTSWDGDRHVLVVDKDANRLYEIGNAYPQSDGSWNASGGAIFHLDSNNVRPTALPGWTSADAAGLPIFAGLARYEEAASGAIRHALRFTVNQSRHAYVPPATHWAASGTSENLPPMGMRVRLKASFVIPTTFSAETQTLLHAMKTFGLIAADNGSSWFISGAPDERWDNETLLDELGQVHGSDFEVVRMEGIVTDVP